MQQVGVLGDHPDRVGDRRLGQRPHVVPVEQHRAAIDVVEPRDEVGDRRLARPAGPDDRRQPARLDHERRLAHRPGPVVRRLRHGRRHAGDVGLRVGEPDVVELDPPGDRGRVEHLGAGGVDDPRPQVEVLEDPAEQGKGGLDVEGDAQEVDRGEQQSRLQGRERDDGARRHPRVRGDQQARDQVDQRRGDPQEGLHDREERLPGHRLAHLQVDLSRVLGGVAADLRLLPVEHLRQQHAGDRQRLLGDRRHVGQRLLRAPGEAPAHPPDPDLQQHEHRQQDHGDESELPRQQQHGDQRGDDRHDVGQDGAGRLRQHRLDPADVVGQP